jgi:hypothetical protein
LMLCVAVLMPAAMIVLSGTTGVHRATDSKVSPRLGVVPAPLPPFMHVPSHLHTAAVPGTGQRAGLGAGVKAPGMVGGAVHSTYM